MSTLLTVFMGSATIESGGSLQIPPLSETGGTKFVEEYNILGLKFFILGKCKGKVKFLSP